MRPRTACRSCQTRRRKCDRDAENGRVVCSLCLKYNRSCVPTVSTSQRFSSSTPEHVVPHATSSSVRRPHITPASVHPPRRGDPVAESATTTLYATNPGLGSSDQLHTSLLPPGTVIAHCCNLYFDYVHDQLHTLFQRPAFMVDLATGKIPPVILLAIIALSARFSTHTYFGSLNPRTRGIQYMQQAAQLLDPSDVNLTGIQACVLLGACRIVEGDAAGESVYYGMACRMAQLLDLPNRACRSRLERETNIRVWHTLVMIDEWSSSGVNIPRQISHSPNHIPLPMEEMTYLSLRQQDAQYTAELHSPVSLLGQMIVLNNIFKQVNQLNVKTAQDQDKTPKIAEIKELTMRLDAWESSLPDYMRDTPPNLAHYAAQGLGRIFAAVYLGFYHYGQLLMYQFLHHDASNNPTTSHFSQRCKSFAEKLCDMVYAALDTPGCDVLYNMVGHVLVIASTVQIHTLLFAEDNDEIAAARTRLERNYTILLRLRQLWPSLDFCMMRLKVFHRACIVSMETSFKLDDWMLRFLSEFAKPVDERNGENSSWGVGDISITPSSDFDLDSLAILLDAAPNV